MRGLTSHLTWRTLSRERSADVPKITQLVIGSLVSGYLVQHSFCSITEFSSNNAKDNNNNSNDLHLYSSSQFKNLGWFNRVKKRNNGALLMFIVLIFTGAEQNKASKYSVCWETTGHKMRNWENLLLLKTGNISFLCFVQSLHFSSHPLLQPHTQQEVSGLGGCLTTLGRILYFILKRGKTTIIPIIQVSHWRHRESRRFAKGCTASERERRFRPRFLGWWASALSYTALTSSLLLNQTEWVPVRICSKCFLFSCTFDW